MSLVVFFHRVVDASHMLSATSLNVLDVYIFFGLYYFTNFFFTVLRSKKPQDWKGLFW
jgi:hypothetical protein